MIISHATEMIFNIKTISSVPSKLLSFTMRTMHTSVALLVFFAVVIAVSNSAKYSGRFDNIDLDEVLRSDRLLKNYFECLMERGPCTPEGSELKRTIPDAIQTDCSRCSEVQKNKAAKAIKYIEENKPDMFKELQEKYDPEGNYRERIRENLHLNKTEESSE